MKTLLCVWLGFVASVSLAFCGAASLPIKSNLVPPQRITALRLWNTNPDERILLRADGTASYFGLDLSSRPGVGEYRGRFPPEEFRRLTDTLTAQGFFRLKEQYIVPDTARHIVYSIAVVRDGQPEKLVFTNGGRVPAELIRLKAAIHNRVSAVTWREGRSGVRGFHSAEHEAAAAEHHFNSHHTDRIRQP